MKNRRNPKVYVNWSELHPDLVDYIARKLTIYTDYVRFRAVCVKWRSAVPPLPHHLPIQLPWLMLQSGPQSAFFSLSANKVHRFDLPETRGRRCCGSSQGWLVLVEENPTIILLNPLTRTQFNLPPSTTFPSVLDFNAHEVGGHYLTKDCGMITSTFMRDNYVKKVVLSSSPTSLDNDYYAVAILKEKGKLVFCRKGTDAWTKIESHLNYGFEDVICHKNIFYAINSRGVLKIFDVSRVSSLLTQIAAPLPRADRAHKVYLVESLGELLLVKKYRYIRYADEPIPCYDNRKTVGFDVFILDTSNEPKWVKMESLGDRILFLGINSSFCFLATDFSGYEGNCIYFTRDKFGRYFDENLKCWVDDSGIFSLGESTIKPLPYDHKLFTTPPIWFTPNPS